VNSLQDRHFLVRDGIVSPSVTSAALNSATYAISAALLLKTAGHSAQFLAAIKFAGTSYTATTWVAGDACARTFRCARAAGGGALSRRYANTGRAASPPRASPAITLQTAAAHMPRLSSILFINATTAYAPRFFYARIFHNLSLLRTARRRRAVGGAGWRHRRGHTLLRALPLYFWAVRHHDSGGIAVTPDNVTDWWQRMDVGRHFAPRSWFTGT